MTKIKEIWKEIDGWENYLISSLGNVRSLRRNIILKPSINSNGYFQIALCKNSIGYPRRIHRLIALAFIPNPLNKATVNHKNGIKTDNSIDNLEWATDQENIAHAFATGLRFRVPWGKPILNEDQVRAILRATGPFEDIARDFGVHKSTIWIIKKRKTWKHVKI